MTPETSTSPKFFLMCCNMYLHESLDERLVKEWFPLHFIGCPRLHYSTSFFMAEDETEVLETLLKAQHLRGLTYLLSEDAFVRLLGDCMDSQYDPWVLSWEPEERTVVTVHSWRERMRMHEEREAGGDDLMHDEIGDEDRAADSPGDAWESAQEPLEEEDHMSVDSESDHDTSDDDEEDSEGEDIEEHVLSTEIRQLQHKFPQPDFAFDRAFTDKKTLCLSEECNVPTSSVAGYLI